LCTGKRGDEQRNQQHQNIIEASAAPYNVRVDSSLTSE
jgi:hypothetical protein